jgi:CheY-like chemotaxis protein
VARILICEPHDDTIALLELVVRRLGHQPLVYVAGDPDALDVDAAVIEPGDPACFQMARRLRVRGIPLLFTSIYPPEADTLDLDPAAYLVKPFPLYALERALEEALVPTAAHRASAAAL